MDNGSQVKRVEEFDIPNIIFIGFVLATSHRLLTSTTLSIRWIVLCLAFAACYAFGWVCSDNNANRFFGVVATATIIWLGAIMFGIGPHPLAGTYYSPEMGSFTFLRNGSVVSDLTGPTFPGSPSFGDASSCSGTYSVDGESIDISPCSSLQSQASPQDAAIASMFIGAMDMQGSVTADKRAVIIDDERFDKQ